jgi:hypothetical protein
MRVTESLRKSRDIGPRLGHGLPVLSLILGVQLVAPLPFGLPGAVPQPFVVDSVAGSEGVIARPAGSTGSWGGLWKGTPHRRGSPYDGFYGPQQAADALRE